MSSRTVYVVDDDESFVTALSRLLRLNGLEPKPFTSASRFLESLDGSARGCVLADLSMPDMSGFELQERLAASPAPMPIVFLTGHGDIPASVRAMRNGAVDFLEKRVPAEELLRAVCTALERDALESTSRARLTDIRSRFARLSAREHEVLQHVVEGRMIKEIAAALDIHERTVKLHRTAITRKVGVQSSALLATLVREAGLFRQSPPEASVDTAA
jgi:FixJ family two-component response regulator